MFKRILEKTIDKQLFKGKTIIIYGARQVGKTTLSRNLLGKHKEKTLYIDCDLLANREILASQNLEKFKKLFQNKDLIVIDEAQKVKNIGLNLKIIHDNFKEKQIIATGSSSFDLANNINEPMTGRAFDYMLFPLSFEEAFKNQSYTSTLENLNNILRFGLYPEVFQSDENYAIKLLNSISSNYLYKDILEFENLKRSDQLFNLLQMLALQISQEVSYTEIAKKLKINTATVQKYVSLLEKSFVIFRLRGFSRNLRKEINKSVKIYFWDLGIRNGLIRNFNDLHLRNDAGALWENFFIAERLKYLNNHQKFANFYFWRTYDQKEIDLIEESGGKLRAFECKWNSHKKAKVPKLFLETYSESSFEVISPDNFDEFLS